ncbi:MAG TPA: glycoside hydrolase family 13 protein [Sunxiuqinia sp.]|nr:glycoside hydrolase family 13 protein [Sunxiuqinia sp.]
MKKIAVVLFFILIGIGQLLAVSIDRVEPMFWWVGMKNPKLQLMVHGENIASTKVEMDYPGVRLESVDRVQNPNYLFLNLIIGEQAQPGIFNISFLDDHNKSATYSYELKTRKKGSSKRVGFNSSDVIYLITPDRFANGNPDNDNMPGMIEQANRSDKDGRHGGDLQGIIDHLDYIQKMGFTSIWITPVLENNMPRTSYHGYAITDYYKVDPRFGSNEQYHELSADLKKRGMKLIMDMVFNHCGSSHWWMDDLPMPDWINNYPDIKITSNRRTVNEDPHASKIDRWEMVDGWFVKEMPDLNQRNPFLANYLIENSIWWIEYAGLSGIRQDTWPYPDKYMMAEWTKRVLEEYPNFNIVGEEYTTNPAIVSYWQKGQTNTDGFQCDLPSLMDFPLQNAVANAMRDSDTWDKGLIEIYDALANDFLYPDPNSLVVFPDNHDMQRIYTQLDEKADLDKMVMAFYLTTRGIPQIYYGTEILKASPGPKDDGIIRSDFPGGWAGDSINAFTGVGLTGAQKDMQNYMRTILNWRKNDEAMHSGKLMHFVPKDGLYVYFRYNDDETVMVVLNKNKEEKELTTDRFQEITKGFTHGTDIISSTKIEDISKFSVPARSAMIIELEK